MSSYGLENYLGPNLMGAVKENSALGGMASGGSGSPATGGVQTDYQAIYDGAQPHGTAFPPGQGGYTRRAGPAGSVILEPHGRLGAPTYQVTAEGSVYAKPVRPNAEFTPVAGAGTVNTASGGQTSPAF